MTEQLEKAVQHLKNLPPDQQDAIAALIFEELEDDAKWDASFATSPQLLEQLANEVEKEIRKNKTQPLDPTQL